MSRTAHKLLSASGAKGYEIDSSVMFDVTDNSYLKRDYGSSANSYRKWTFSTWFKNDSTNYSGGSLWTSWNNSTQSDTSYGWIGFYQDKLQVGGWSTNWRVTNRLFRDVGAWMHLVIAVDTTIADGSADNRIRIYINGVEETSFATKNNPSQNTELPWNKNQQHRLGAINGSTAYYLGGYLAETQVIDGSQLTPSSFGETDAVTGQWIPKKYTGTYPAYSFYLPFKKNDRYSPYFTGSTTTGIACADSTDWDFGSGDFTMEAWIYRHEDLGQTGYIMGQCDQTSGANAACGAYLLVGSNNQPYCYAIDASNTNNYVTLTSSSHTIADNKWYHIAVSRNSSTWKLFLDGTAISTVTSSIAVNNVGDVFGVGKLGIYTAGHWQGWISNARVVKGTAVYTSDFTPSTTPLTAVTNTVLLCCQDKNVTTDNSGTSKSLSVTAAQTYTEQMAPFTYDWYQDQSGQDNHYQADNLTVDDVMLDTPTNNFCTLNSIQPFNTTIGVLDQGNLRLTAGTYDSGHYANLSSTFNVPASGKWYVECYIGISVGTGNVTVFGVTDQDIDWSGVANENLTGMDGFFTSLYGDYIKVVDSGTLGTGNTSATATSYILGMALDVDNGYAYFGVDNGSAMVWYKADGSTSGGDPTSGSTGTGGFARTFTTNDTITVSVSKNAPGYTNNGSFNILNFGQNGTFSGYQKDGGNTDGNGRGSFFRAPPSGYLALCSKNLPTPAVKKSSEHFDIATYTGTGSTRSVTGLDHQPDILWIKARSTTDDHRVQDAVRGSTKQLDVNNTDEEYTASDGITSFNSDGFTIGADSSNQFNVNTETYVAWSWKANGSGGANNSGDINATVSANTTAGISIVKWTANGSNADTIAHGLGVKPSVVWYKKIDNGGHGWYVLTDAIDGSQDYLSMNTTTAPLTSAGAYGWQTSSTISNWTWNDGHGMIAYCFAEVEGFSKFGNYTGNGSTNGVYVNCGFTPSYLLFKNHSGSAWWWQKDTARNPINLATLILFPNATTADYTSSTNGVDFLSNGFKLRATNDLNGSSQNVFYMAFAEFPFKYANAR